jgi:hypothetical protein
MRSVTGRRMPSRALGTHLLFASALCLALMSLAIGHARAAELAIVTRAVHFAPGASAAHYSSAVGYEARDYVVRARRGQTLTVLLHGQARVYFNVLAGRDAQALYNGSLDGERARLVLPADGCYTVRVYQMGARATAATYDLEIVVNGQQTARRHDMRHRAPVAGATVRT